MVIRFSDRIGVTKIPDALQLNGMDDALRNSLWNYLLKRIFPHNEYQCKLSSRIICEEHFKLPVDTLPPYGPQRAGWLRNFFFHKDFSWWQVYNLVDFVAENCSRIRFGLNRTNSRKTLTKYWKITSRVIDSWEEYWSLYQVQKRLTASIQASLRHRRENFMAPRNTWRPHYCSWHKSRIPTFAIP